MQSHTSQVVYTKVGYDLPYAICKNVQFYISFILINFEVQALKCRENNLFWFLCSSKHWKTTLKSSIPKLSRYNWVFYSTLFILLWIDVHFSILANQIQNTQFTVFFQQGFFSLNVLGRAIGRAITLYNKITMACNWILKKDA